MSIPEFGMHAPQYVNGTQITVSQWDVSIIFSQQVAVPDAEGGNQPVSQVVSVLMMSPQHAKALASILTNLVGQWEKTWGSLPEVDQLLGRPQAGSVE